MIRLENVTKKYGESVILDGFSLSVSRGERILVTGASGRGKTTLLRILSGLERVDEGKAELGKMKKAIAFQEPRLLPHKNALDNVRAVLDRADWSVADGYFEKMGLSIDQDGTKSVSELSGGMKQRVALARFFAFAQVFGAELLILDEPFSALDTEMAERIAHLLADFSVGKTLILASHSRRDAELLGANVLEL